MMTSEKVMLLACLIVTMAIAVGALKVSQDTRDKLVVMKLEMRMIKAQIEAHREYFSKVAPISCGEWVPASSYGK